MMRCVFFLIVIGCLLARIVLVNIQVSYVRFLLDVLQEFLHRFVLSFAFEPFDEYLLHFNPSAKIV